MVCIAIAAWSQCIKCKYSRIYWCEIEASLNFVSFFLSNSNGLIYFAHPHLCFQHPLWRQQFQSNINIPFHFVQILRKKKNLFWSQSTSFTHHTPDGKIIKILECKHCLKIKFVVLFNIIFHTVLLLYFLKEQKRKTLKKNGIFIINLFRKKRVIIIIITKPQSRANKTITYANICAIFH